MESFTILITIAARNLLQARRRTALLGTALALVTMLLVLLMALSQGVTDNMIRAATTLASGHINVAGFYKSTPNDARPIITGTDKIRAVVEANTPELAYVIDRHRGWARIVSETSALQVGLAGVQMDREVAFLDVIQLAPEREYEEGGRDEILGDAAQLAEPDTVLLFADQARRLGVDVGDSVTIVSETLRGERNTSDARVVAIARDLGVFSNFTAFVPKATVLKLYQLKPDTSGAVMIFLRDIDKAEQVMGHLREVFAEEGYELMDHDPQPFFAKFTLVSGEEWTGQKLDLTTWEDEVIFLTWIVAALDTLSFFLIGVLVVIIAIGITNTMFIAVRERTGELGTLRAIGMSRVRVLVMVLLEAFILGLAASSLGALTGMLLSLTLNAAEVTIPIAAVRFILLSDTLKLSVAPWQILQAVAFFTAVTALAALLPAVRAARMQPVTAIQQIE